jgi:lipoyl(octanoyl) transferase
MRDQQTEMTAPSQRTCWRVDLGLIPYAQSLEFQYRVVAARKAGAVPDVLLLCEHPHVITQGRNGKPEHLLGSERVLRQMGVEFFDTRRGGDVTYHGPGQLIAYPIFDLSRLRPDLVWFVRRLEDAMIAASAEMGIPAERLLPNWEGKTGVWVRDPAKPAAFPPAKLGAIGVHVSRWVTSHGLAWNVSTDLRYFDLIVPCGIAGCRAASLEQLLGRAVDFGEASRALSRQMGSVFSLTLEEISPDELAARLSDWEGEGRGTLPPQRAQAVATHP